MNCPFRRGDDLKCINRDMSEYGWTAYVDSIGDKTENGWEVTFIGGGGRNRIIPGKRYDTSDFQRIGRHSTIGQGMFGTDKW